MNAPAAIRVENIGWTREERAHRAAITTHIGNASETEMHLRVQLAMLRDQSAAALAKCCDEAAPLLEQASRLATQAVYAPMPNNRLFLMRCALWSTIEAARAIERAMCDGGR